MLTKKITLLLATMASIGVAMGAAQAASSGVHLDKANNDVANVASLQRGARNVVNYCYGCHSAQYVRFSRVAEDLGLTEQQLMQNLMFTGERPTDKMRNSMAGADGARWFGKAPPDLSLIARSKGTDYIYTFLRSFYLDPARPTGTNNTVLPGASMPHVLWELQGLQVKDEAGKADEHGDVEKQFTGFKRVTDGKLSPQEYDVFVRDIVNFLDYIGEPVQLKRKSMGIWVLTFLIGFFLLTYFLKKEIWKDVK